MTQIYIPLLDEGTSVWRPVSAVDLGAGVFRIGTLVVPEDEQWAFQPGEIVRCERRTLEAEPVLVAVERVAAAV